MKMYLKSIFLTNVFCFAMYAMESRVGMVEIAARFKQNAFVGRVNQVASTLESEALKSASLASLDLVSNVLACTKDRLSALVTFQGRVCEYWNRLDDVGMANYKDWMARFPDSWYGFWLPVYVRSTPCFLKNHMDVDGELFKILIPLLAKVVHKTDTFSDNYQELHENQKEIGKKLEAYLRAHWDLCKGPHESPDSQCALVCAAVVTALTKKLNDRSHRVVLQ